MSNLEQNELYKTVLRISERFYEKVYKDQWFKKLFRNIEEEVISRQQAAFMTGALGGPKSYCGRMPKDAHPQIWVNEEIWNHREKLLQQTFDELKTEPELQEKWLRIDNAFKGAIMNKGGPEECVGRYATDDIIYEPKPGTAFKKAA